MKKLLISLSLLTFLATACSVHNPDDIHIADDEKIPHAAHAVEDFVAFSEKHELFIEIDELFQGEEAHMHAQITTLDHNYGPLSGAQIDVQVMMGGKQIQQLLGEAISPGIYDISFTPKKAAVVDLLFIITTSLETDTVELHHLHVKGTETGGHEHAHSSPKRGEVTFTKEQAWTTEFRVEPVIIDIFSRVITASGEMTAMPGEKQNISAKAEGLILFTSRDLVQGSKVNKGDLLFTISGDGLADNNVAVKFNETKTKYLLSKSNYDRQYKLYKQQVVSERQFLEARSSYITDSVMYFSLSKTVTTGGMKIYAPMSGYLHELNVSEGQFVSTGQLLVTLSTNRIILLRADLPQQHYLDLELINDASFRPAYSTRVYTIQELSGRLLAKGSSVAENNHYLPVYFEVTNDGTLLEGAYVEFYLKTEPLPGKLIIPVSSLIEEQNNFYVYVQVSGETYSKRYVTVEATDGISAAISDGLIEGERIVTTGAMLVKTASISSAPSHGHQH